MGSTKLGGKRVKGCGGSLCRRDTSTADDAGRLRASTRCQLILTDSDETIEGGGAETEASAASSVRVIDDIRQTEGRVHGIRGRKGGIKDETATGTACVTCGGATVLGR